MADGEDQMVQVHAEEGAEDAPEMQDDIAAEIQALRNHIRELEERGRHADQRDRHQTHHLGEDSTGNRTPSHHTAHHGAQQSDAMPLPTINVQVKAPTPAPHLGIFTGLRPSGGGELGFNDWLERVQQYLIEAPEEEDAFRRVKASVRGLAAEQIKNCADSVEIITHLKETYGTTQTSEDLYHDFVRMQSKKGEAPSDFFSRVWDKFVLLNKGSTYSAEEANRKVYHTFSVNIREYHSMLALELRNRFGLPGVASPESSSVLRRIRELEGMSASAASTASTTKPVRSAAVQQETSIDYERLADMVADRFRTTMGVFNSIQFMLLVSQPTTKAISGMSPRY